MHKLLYSLLGILLSVYTVSSQNFNKSTTPVTSPSNVQQFNDDFDFSIPQKPGSGCDTTGAVWVYQNFGDNNGFIWQMHEQYSHDFSISFMAVTYDTIVDVGGTTYNYDDWLITVDSVVTPVYHMNQSGNTDNFVTKIVTLDGNGLPTNTALYADTFKTSTGLTGHPSGGGSLVSINAEMDYEVPPNTRFGARLDYFGPTQDTLWTVIDYFEGCSGSCFATYSPWVNSLFDFNHSAVGGLQATNNHTFYYDCNGNGQNDTSAACEIPPLQEARVITYLSFDKIRLQASPDTMICVGDTVRLQANAESISGDTALTYRWYPATGLTDSSLSNPKAAPSTNTTYKVVVTDTVTNCVDSSTTTVDVVSSVTADAGNDTSICTGTSVTLTPSGGNAYVWIDTGSTSTLSCDTCENPVANPIYSPTEYQVIAHVGSCNDTDAIVITQDPLPTATVDPSDTSVCEGGSVQLSANGGLSYNWSPSAGLNDTTVQDPIASPNSTTTYTVSVTDANGCTDDTSVKVTVNNIPPINDILATKTDMCEGDTSELFVDPNTYPGYQWKPPFDIENPNSAQTDVWPDVTRTYTVEVTDANGCKNEDSIKITVAGAPPQAGFTKSVAGLKVDLTNTSQDANQCRWSASDGWATNMGAGACTDTSHTFSEAGTYEVKLEVKNGCDTDVFTDSVSVTGINEMAQLERSLEVYPNPTTDNIQLSFNTDYNTDVEIIVYDVTGRQVMNKSVTDHVGTYQQQIELGDAPEGIYNIKLITDEGVAYRKVVRQ
jgi:hypothetical protein